MIVSINGKLINLTLVRSITSWADGVKANMMGPHSPDGVKMTYGFVACIHYYGGDYASISIPIDKYESDKEPEYLAKLKEVYDALIVEWTLTMSQTEIKVLI